MHVKNMVITAKPFDMLTAGGCWRNDHQIVTTNSTCGSNNY